MMYIQGKAAHIRSKQHLTSKVSALSAEPNPIPPIREEGPSCNTSEDGMDREQGDEEAEEADEGPGGVELITSDHIRSAVIMGNLIEGRDMDEGTECMTGGGIFSGVSLATNDSAVLSLFCQTAGGDAWCGWKLLTWGDERFLILLQCYLQGGHIQQELLEAMFGRLKQQLRPGQTVGEHALMEALGERNKNIVILAILYSYFTSYHFALMSPYQSNTRCPSQILKSPILLAEGQSDNSACEAISSVTAVAVEPTALLTVSREAYNSCLQAFHSEQSKQQLAFFESISIFRGAKKQVSGVFIMPHVPDGYL